MGDVVLLELLKARALLPKFSAGLDAFCLIEDEALRPETLKFIQELRWSGLAVEYSLTPGRSDKQFKRAQELQASWIATLQRVPQGDLLARIKNLKTREEKTVRRAEVAREIAAARNYQA